MSVMKVSIALLLLVFKCEHVSASKVFVNRVRRADKCFGTFPSVHKNLKLPVWPVLGGALIQMADFVNAKDLAQRLWSTIGGRVVPITLHPLDVSPFLLLAHHAHSFTPLDPLRPISNLVLPEGFPAHPHSGFDTVTYCIEGGLRHRDSEGCKMSYGDGEVQWMRAGKGIIHEEMWDVFDSPSKHKRIEIFQIWVNLPTSSKSKDPQVKVLSKASIPVIKCGENGESCKVIAGDVCYGDSMDSHIGPGNDVADSPVSILHVSLPSPSSKFRLDVPMDSSVIVYVRSGSLLVNSLGIDIPDNESTKEPTAIPIGEVTVGPGDMTIYKYNTDENLVRFRDVKQSADTKDNTDASLLAAGIETITGVVDLQAGKDGLDCLVLIGQPLRERVFWSGPFVMSSEFDLYAKANAFSDLGSGIFWDYKISDAEWLQHCKKIDLQRKLDEAEMI